MNARISATEHGTMALPITVIIGPWRVTVMSSSIELRGDARRSSAFQFACSAVRAERSSILRSVNLTLRCWRSKSSSSLGCERLDVAEPLPLELWVDMLGERSVKPTEGGIHTWATEFRSSAARGGCRLMRNLGSNVYSPVEAAADNVSRSLPADPRRRASVAVRTVACSSCRDAAGSAQPRQSQFLISNLESKPYHRLGPRSPMLTQPNLEANLLGNSLRIVKERAASRHKSASPRRMASAPCFRTLPVCPSSPPSSITTDEVYYLVAT